MLFLASGFTRRSIVCGAGNAEVIAISVCIVCYLSIDDAVDSHSQRAVGFMMRLLEVDPYAFSTSSSSALARVVRATSWIRAFEDSTVPGRAAVWALQGDDGNNYMINNDEKYTVMIETIT